MATSKKAKTETAPRAKAESTPAFPYTTKPASLRRFLKEVPKRPKPTKFDRSLLKSWGFSDSNDLTMLRVLRAVGLVNDKNEPTELYSRFMMLDDGAKALAPEIRRVYGPLFQASHKPYDESNEKLRNLFNIHSGGGDRALDQQIQTFKALSENTSFEADGAPPASGAAAMHESSGRDGGAQSQSQDGRPTVNINLHIHLPENKSRREYEDIIEDIGRYIFGRDTGGRRA
jgi:hypothetical protein